VFERFTQESKNVLARAQTEARELGHNFIGTEHVLLGLAGTDADAILGRLGAPMPGLRAAVVALVGRGTGQGTGSPPFTAKAKKALELSLREALARNDRTIRPEHLLLGLLREGEGVAAQVLREAGVTHAAFSPLVGPPQSTWDPGRRIWRRAFRGPSNFPSSIVGNATPGAEALPITARRVAGSDPVSTYHYLVALLEEGVAAGILQSLGVTREAVADKFAELGTAGTSDAMPSVPVEVEGEQFRVTPDQAEQIRRWLRREGPPPLPPDA
jgi:ATP-dependent Clp protease ATP-binding subunit ClpC